MISSNNDNVLLKSAYCGIFKGIYGRSYAHTSLPVSDTSSLAVGEFKFATPRRGTDADELSFVATCGNVGFTPLSFDMYRPNMLKHLRVSLTTLMSDAKHRWYMGSPPQRSVPYGKCIDCGTGTRSHIIQPPEYEEFEREVMVGSSDVHSSKQWAEFDTINVWERTQEATVMCHKCWLVARDKMIANVKEDVPKWMESPLAHMRRIKSFLEKWNKFEFGLEMPDEEANNLVAELKQSVRRSARGE